MPDELLSWIQNEFPVIEVEFRGRIFKFHNDLPVHNMGKLTGYGELTKEEKMRRLIQLQSIDPIISEAAADEMPSKMLMAFISGIFGKKAPPSSQIANTESISSAQL